MPRVFGECSGDIQEIVDPRVCVCALFASDSKGLRMGGRSIWAVSNNGPY